jgi:hypothetical protein
MTGGWSGMKDVEELKIACFGRSIGMCSFSKLMISEPEANKLYSTYQEPTG